MGRQDYIFNVGDEINIGRFHGIILRAFRNKEGRKSYQYRCLKCGYDIGEKTEISIVKGFGCPCCANRVVVPGINDIPTTDPWMIKYFQGGIKEASLYSKSCGKVIIPKCPDCGRLVKAQTVNSIYTHKGVSCICGDGISFPNKMIYFVMEQLSKNSEIINFVREYYIPEKNKYFDIYFETESHGNYFIEMDGGIRHGDVIKSHESSQSKSFKFYPSSLFANDIVKEKIAKSLNIGLIRIDCYYSDFEYIKNNILKSALNSIVNLSCVNWENVEKQSYSNLMKIICRYKKDNPKAFVKDAAEKFKLSDETIRTYWGKGNSLGWCSFDRKSESIRSRKARTYYGQSCRVILENVNRNKRIEFNSVADFIRNSAKYFKHPLSRKMAANRFKKFNNFIENYEGYNIYKLRRNCDGICKSS